MEDVEAICGLKRSSIYEGQAQGWFPRAYRLSGTRVGWKLSDVMAWFNSRPRWDGSNK
jgi:prophage regulatory protein